MATRNLQQAPGTLTSKDKLPQRRYAVRCIEEVFGQSSKGNGMITRTWEKLANSKSCQCRDNLGGLVESVVVLLYPM